MSEKITILKQDYDALQSRLNELEKALAEIKDDDRIHRQFQTLFQNARDIIFFVEKTTGRIVEANPAAIKAYGYEKDELLSMTIHELGESVSRKSTAAKMAEANEQGGLFEAVHVRKDGSGFPIEINSTGIRLGAEQILLTVIRDLTERKEAEAAIRLQAEIAKNIAEGIYLVDTKDLKIVYANPTMETMFGYAPGEMDGKPVSIINAPTDKDPVQTAREIEAQLRLNGSYRGDVLTLKKDGSPFWSRTTISQMHHPYYGNVYLSLQTDISERKAAEEALRASEKVLRRSHDELENLVKERTSELTVLNEQLRKLSEYLQKAREDERSRIAREIHDDLGQTLTALKMDIVQLRKRLPKDETQIVDQVSAMVGLVDAMVESVKKISTELRPGLLDHLGLSAAVEWQVQEFERRRGIPCELTVDPKEIQLDKDRTTAVFRIFQETLTNVVRHAMATKVFVLLQVRDANLILQVKDNGKGISESEMASPSSFGLMGIRERVNSLSGSLSIVGIPTEGTTVTASFPLGDAGVMIE